jgi:hypothetical protein
MGVRNLRRLAGRQEGRKHDGLCRLMARNMGWDFDTVKQTMKRIGKGRR